MVFLKNNFLPKKQIVQNFIYLLNALMYDKQYPEMMFALAITHIKILPKIWGHPSKYGIKTVKNRI